MKRKRTRRKIPEINPENENCIPEEIYQFVDFFLKRIDLEEDLVENQVLAEFLHNGPQDKEFQKYLKEKDKEEMFPGRSRYLDLEFLWGEYKAFRTKNLEKAPQGH